MPVPDSRTDTAAGSQTGSPTGSPTGSQSGSRTGRAIAIQLTLVWLFGALSLPAGYGILPPMGLHGSGRFLVALALAVAVFVFVLWLIVRETADASYLGDTTRRQLSWAVRVFVLGIAMWGAGRVIAGPGGSPTRTFLLSGVPFVLAAGLFLRPRYLKVATLVALAGLVASVLIPPRESGPDELSRRLAYANVDRATMYVVEIAGYRPSDTVYGDRLGTDTFIPADPSAVPAHRYINIAVYRHVVGWPQGVCGETADGSPLMMAECTAEPDGLVYRRGVVDHGYQIRRGEAMIVISGSHAVERDVLRGAVRNVRPVTAADLAGSDDVDGRFVADVPGYRAMAVGTPPGMLLQPTDPAAAPHSVNITLRADRSEPECVRAKCEAESATLTYRRAEDTHGYLLRRGDVAVQVSGGISVDRALLRQTVYAARPATDAELLRALPPAPPAGRLDRLRSWLRAHT